MVIHLVHLDFQTEAFIQAKDINDFERAIEEIIFLDRNDEHYIERLKKPKFNIDNTLEVWEAKLLCFLNNIFNQSLSSAGRKPEYGFNKYHNEEMKLQAELLNRREARNIKKTKIKTLFTNSMHNLFGHKS